MTIFTNGLRMQQQAPGIHELEASVGEGLGATVSSTLADSPTAQLAGISELSVAKGGLPLGLEAPYIEEGFLTGKEQQPIPDVPMREAKQKVKDAGLDSILHLGDQDKIKESALDIMMKRARERREREATMSRGLNGFVPNALSVGTSFLVGAVDPLNLAAAFIPVIGELRYAKLMATAGEGVLARAGVRAEVGAASGAVGMIPLQPLEAYARSQEGQDFTMAEALRNVMFGAALGGVLHTGGGAVADVLRRRKGNAVYPFGEGDLFDRSPKTEPSILMPETQPAAGGARSVYDDVLRQLKETGMSDDQAQANAAIVASRYATRAERLGQEPESVFDLYKQEGLDVRLTQAADALEGGRQFAQSGDRNTDTPEFKAWFGESAATDHKGDPLVVYHGSNKRFGQFKTQPGMRREEYGSTFEVESPAFFFTADRDKARSYAQDRVLIDERLRKLPGGKAEVRPFYLSSKNPLDFTIDDATRIRMREEGYSSMYNPDAPNPYALREIEEITGYSPETWRNVQEAMDDPRVVRELKDRGFDGVKLREEDGTEAWGVFDPTQIKSVNNRGSFGSKDPRFLFQGASEGRPRGRITLDSNKAVIELFEKANASTFIHEAGHLWLDELVRDAAHEKAPQKLKDDLAAALKWMRVEGADKIGVREHEMWARTFERYLATGEAPSNALQGVFEKFKDWLLVIYHTLREIGRPLPPSIRQVMDRMIATDRELAERKLAPELLTIRDLPQNAQRNVMQAGIASITRGEPVKAQEMIEMAAKTDPRIAESLKLSKPDESVAGAEVDRAIAQKPIDEAEWRSLAAARPEYDEPNVLAKSYVAERLEEPGSLAIEPTKRMQAAAKAEEEAVQLYQSAEPYLDDGLKFKVQEELAKLDQNAADTQTILKRGAACLASAFGV